jgi:hypothetical protein
MLDVELNGACLGARPDVGELGAGPQFEMTTDLSIGTLPRRIGSMPPAMPMIATWPPGTTAAPAIERVVGDPSGAGSGVQGQLERLGAHVDRDHASAAQRAQELHGDMAEASDADDDRARAGLQVRERT